MSRDGVLHRFTSGGNRKRAVQTSFKRGQSEMLFDDGTEDDPASPAKSKPKHANAAVAPPGTHCVLCGGAAGAILAVGEATTDDIFKAAHACGSSCRVCRSSATVTAQRDAAADIAAIVVAHS